LFGEQPTAIVRNITKAAMSSSNFFTFAIPFIYFWAKKIPLLRGTRGLILYRCEQPLSTKAIKLNQRAAS